MRSWEWKGKRISVMNPTVKSCHEVISDCRNSPGCSFIPLKFMLYILTYFNMNMLEFFNIIIKISFRFIF